MIAVTQALKRLICRVLIGVFVSAQFAITAYACPGLSGSLNADAPAGMEAQGSMPASQMQAEEGHASMDPALPHLCMGHCQLGNQSADHPPAPSVTPALLTAIYTLPLAGEPADSRVPRASALLGGPPGVGDPPHAILHCCFRD